MNAERTVPVEPPPRAADGHPDATDWPTMAAALMQARQTVLPKRLVDPGPDAGQQRSILAAAASAPDHGQLLPWRFVTVPSARRAALAEVFAQALLERDASASAEQMAQARDKAHRAPWLMLVVVDGLRGDPDVDLHERILSAGCAVQNVLLMATAQGWGSALTSGKALKSSQLRALFGLNDAEHALCFLSIGTVLSRRANRPRPAVSDYASALGPTPEAAVEYPPISSKRGFEQRLHPRVAHGAAPDIHRSDQTHVRGTAQPPSGAPAVEADRLRSRPNQPASQRQRGTEQSVSMRGAGATK